MPGSMVSCTGLRGDHPGVLYRVGRQDQQVYGAVLDGPLLIEARQQQQVLHEHAHPGRFAFDPLHDAVQVLGVQAALVPPSGAATPPRCR